MNEYSNGASLTIDDDNCEEELYFIFVMNSGTQWQWRRNDKDQRLLSDGNK